MKPSNSDSVFEPVAGEAVDGRFDAAIDQLQPKQRCAIPSSSASGPRNMRISKLAIEASKTDASGRPPEWTRACRRLSQFSIRSPSFRTSCSQSKFEVPKGKTQTADVASRVIGALVMARQLFVTGCRDRLGNRPLVLARRLRPDILTSEVVL